MRKWPGLLWLWAVAWLSGQLAPASDAIAAGDATRGREFYLHGAVPGEPAITCTIGEHGPELSATVFRCAQCHGFDGRGKPEGGLEPSNIRWSELTKPYAVAAVAGRRRSPYSEESLGRALTAGLDPDGRPLNTAMPRYHLPEAVQRDVIAYLRQIESAPDPGVTETEIVIGMILPPPGMLESLSAALQETIAASFAEVNRVGGIYGRRLRLVTVAVPQEGRVEAWQSFLHREHPFALVNSYIAGQEATLLHLTERAAVPFLQPIGLYSRSASPPGRYTFFLTPGIEAQCAALVRYAAAELGSVESKTLLHVYDDEAAGELVRVALQRATTAAGWPPPVSLKATPAHDWSATLAAHHPAAILWTAQASPEECMRAAQRERLQPWLLAPGAMVTPEWERLSPESAPRVFLAFPNLPDDQSDEGREELRRLAKDHPLGTANPAARLAALSSARMLIHLLETTGRELTRERLIEGAEQLQDFDTGHMRPLTFGPDRRTGSAGAHIVRLQAGGHLELPAKWIECDRP